MKYLIRAKGQKNSAHYWNEAAMDTLCTMWTTGGMDRRRKWLLLDSPGEHPICHMCATKAAGVAV